MRVFPISCLWAEAMMITLITFFPSSYFCEEMGTAVKDLLPSAGAWNLIFLEGRYSPSKVSFCFCWSQSQKFLAGSQGNMVCLAALQGTKHPPSCPIPHPNHILGLSAGTIHISVLFMGSRQSAQFLSCSPLLMLDRERCREEEERPWETPFLLPSSFDATAKSILKPSRLKWLWEHRTVCTLPPPLAGRAAVVMTAAHLHFPQSPGVNYCVM